MNTAFADIHVQYLCIQQRMNTAIANMFAGYGQARDYPASWGATRFGNQVSIGSNATLRPVTICDDVPIGAGAVFTRNIEEADIYAGVRQMLDWNLSAFDSRLTGQTY